jgi:hypothetical protein
MVLLMHVGQRGRVNIAKVDIAALLALAAAAGPIGLTGQAHAGHSSYIGS